MSKEQLYTINGNLEMAEVNNGTVPVDCVRMYRHAGDHDAGNDDSWFINVVAKLEGSDGGTILERFTLKMFLDHGKPKEFCGNVAKNILMAGEIDLSLWSSDTRRSR